MKFNITISECTCLAGVNAMLERLYFDMVIDQTEGMALRLQHTPNLHVLLAADDGGARAYIYAIKTSVGTEIHAAFPIECRGAWGVEAAMKSLAYLRREYGMKVFISGRYSCHRPAGVFLNRIGFKKVKTFNTGNTKDGVPLSYTTYKLEIK